MPDEDEEIAGLLALAKTRRAIAMHEAATLQRGPISERMRAIGIHLTDQVPEAVLEAFFWEGIATGLAAASSSSLRRRLADEGYSPDRPAL